MSLNFNSVKIVILSEPVRLWQDEAVRRLFCEMVELKVRGYQSEYPPNVLPLTKDDFFGTHLMICETGSDQSLHPVVAYKSVALMQCDFFRFEFPALSILRNSGVDSERLERIVERCRAEGIGLSYDSSWTMLPEKRKDRAFSKFLRALTTTISVRYHLDYGIPEWVTMGIKRFKTDEYFRWKGAETISPEYRAYTSFDEPARMLHLSRFTDDAIRVADAHSHFWRDRLVLAPAEPSGAGSLPSAA